MSTVQNIPQISTGDKLNTLTTIMDLQQLEKQLYTNLETLAASGDPNSSVEQSQIIKKINDLSKTRISLFNSLKELYDYAQVNVNENRNELVDKMVVAKVMESQLNNMKQMMNELEQVKDNKLRMVQINTYYGKQYQSQTNLMKFIVMLCVIILIVIFLAKRSIISSGVSNLIIIILVAVGGFFIFRKVMDISSRDKMDFDRYPGPSMDDQSTSNYDYDKNFNNFDVDVNTWSICGDGTMFDDKLGQCIVKPAKPVESFSAMSEVIGYNKDSVTMSGPSDYN